MNTVPPAEIERRRQAEAAVADVRISDPASLDDAELVSVVKRLEGLEAELSTIRKQLFHVLDALTAEIERRVAAGLMPTEAAESTS
ncbi:hypothetical protein [Microbacterium sp.]|uniref:RsiG family protein n=1 Tax=Microbacterium sp. TaxID=51671 RepID=UPI002638C424|nr:hypothetical protein [Microbacterium sp.]